MKHKTLILLLLMLWNSHSFAHENTVVIPLHDEDVFITTPSNPVTPEDRSISDFISINGLVYDERTQLAWQKSDDGQQRTWQQAFEYCRLLRAANQTAWRLPTVRELYSIVNVNSANPAINTDVFNSTANDGVYWTQTRDITINPATNTGVKFYAVTFGLGGVVSARDNDLEAFADKHYTRCVI
ncbi:hypothetical protein GCM10008090_34900 [Arenicella chitinivorans]|uniref:Lcl C-terminal domain-containing protein n=1 Tax=Arenicella chitinivorans TaxID=1329800 RepID=A0A918S2W5_9GAMM|nr:DUF1566 domain-containing protein [Arenicella chitinivorans]GHA22091.1 hypothetical protein GCM10008090_34900 [Arenicella chitinivorans]